MKRNLSRVLLLMVGLVLMGGAAFAEIGTTDVVPAATLLLPYFEVDLDNAAGLNTLFSVNNASATAQLAHVTVWSTWSVPVLDFDIYLTGYDVQTLNMRDILVDGLNKLPGVRCLRPRGAFYVFPNITGTRRSSAEVADRLLNEAGVAALSGAAFGAHGEGYLRFSYANSEANLRAALDRMRPVFESLAR